MLLRIYFYADIAEVKLQRACNRKDYKLACVRSVLNKVLSKSSLRAGEINTV